MELPHFSDLSLPVRALAAAGAVALVFATTGGCESNEADPYHGRPRTVHAGSEVFDGYPPDRMVSNRNCAVTDSNHTATPTRRADHVVTDDQTAKETYRKTY